MKHSRRAITRRGSAQLKPPGGIDSQLQRSEASLYTAWADGLPITALEIQAMHAEQIGTCLTLLQEAA
jgi:hypothetical protein